MVYIINMVELEKELRLCAGMLGEARQMANANMSHASLTLDMFRVPLVLAFSATSGLHPLQEQKRDIYRALVKDLEEAMHKAAESLRQAASDWLK